MTAPAIRDLPTDELLARDRADYERLQAGQEPILRAALELARAIEDERLSLSRNLEDERRETQAELLRRRADREAVSFAHPLFIDLIERVGTILGEHLYDHNRFELIRAIVKASRKLPTS